MPSNNLPSLSASLSLMFKYLTSLTSANLAMLSLIWLMIGITARLSLRGVIPISTIVALGAFWRQTQRMAFTPRVTSAPLASSLHAEDSLPTLLVPAIITMTFGLTLSSSPFLSRQRMF